MSVLFALLAPVLSPLALASDARPTAALQETGPTLTLPAPSLEAPGGQALSAWAVVGPGTSSVVSAAAWTPTRRARLHLVGVATASPVLAATDLTLGGTLGVLQGPRHGIDLALVPELTWTPRLGSVQSLEGRLALAAGGRSPTLGWGVGGGIVADTGQDAWAEGGAALRGRLFSRTWLIAEVRGGIGLAGRAQGLRPIDGALGVSVRASERASVLAFTELSVDPVTLEWRWRAALGVRARRTGLPPDVDGDHVGNRADLCTRTAEDIDGYLDLDGCPELDDDGDGLADDKDLCPSEPEDLDGYADSDGCPDPDNDQDGVLEPDDQCPDVPGRPEMGGCPDGDGDGVVDALDHCPARRGTPEAHGCPDWDADGVPDPVDRCPEVAAGPGAVQAVSDGCPTLLWIVGAQVRLREDVPLVPIGGTAVSDAAGPGLQELGALLRAHPSLHLALSPGDADGAADRAATVRTTLLGLGSLPSGQVSVHGQDGAATPWVDPGVDLLVMHIR